ncbi:MAG TPA: MdtA/MuxA family multidrug efflux RND transporter periplasmic adaptor subunit [Blastocatellia bacterium]|nr:MdtA/MuxA family multidrug efflux RND transporter periplasmic adaptor subunit [Blastocatellia bacterium]
MMEDTELPRSNVQRRPGPRKATSYIWLVGLLIIGGAGYLLLEKWQAKHPANAKPGAGTAVPSVQVVAAPARIGDIPVYLTGLGSVTGFNTVTVKSRVDGALTAVAFKEGQLVRQGEVLAEIDPRPYQVQLAQAEAQLAKDQATLTNAQVDLARYQVLAKDSVIPEQQLDTQAAVVRQDGAVIKVDLAQIENAKLQLVYCHITAPLSGRIGLRLVDVGNMIHATDPNGLVVITQVQPIAVLFTIPEDSLREVLKHLRAGEHLEADAYDRSGQTKIATGQLLTLDNTIDPTTGTSRLKAVFDNKDGALFPNQFVNIRLLVELKKDQILVPAAAIQRGPKGTFVYVIKNDRTVEARQVTPGTTEGNDTAIVSGLTSGEQVVVDGVDKLREGSSVVLGPKAKPGV